MIFGCHEMLFCGKCEWTVIQGFVSEYNRQNDATYRLKECLDAKCRNTPQPEVLLVADGRKDIAVERTSVIWPPMHVCDHKRIHRIADRLDREFGRGFASVPMVFECDEAVLPKLRDLSTAMDTICASIAAGRTRGNEPFPWRLRPFILGWDDDRQQTGIGVVVRGTDRWSDASAVSQGREDALAGFARAYSKAIEHASKKFQRRPNEHHIMLVQFLGDDEYVCDEDVNEILRVVAVSALIDEVWAACHEWEDEENYKIGWRRMT